MMFSQCNSLKNKNFLLKEWKFADKSYFKSMFIEDDEIE